MIEKIVIEDISCVFFKENDFDGQFPVFIVDIAQMIVYNGF